jgi:hypothetical protein
MFYQFTLIIFLFDAAQALQMRQQTPLKKKVVMIIIIKEVLCIMYQIPGTLEDKFKREKSAAIVTANHHNSS